MRRCDVVKNEAHSPKHLPFIIPSLQMGRIAKLKETTKKLMGALSPNLEQGLQQIGYLHIYKQVHKDKLIRIYDRMINDLPRVIGFSDDIVDELEHLMFTAQVSCIGDMPEVADLILTDAQRLLMKAITPTNIIANRLLMDDVQEDDDGALGSLNMLPALVKSLIAGELKKQMWTS